MNQRKWGNNFTKKKKIVQFTRKEIKLYSLKELNREGNKDRQLAFIYEQRQIDRQIHRQINRQIYIEVDRQRCKQIIVVHTVYFRG